MANEPDNLILVQLREIRATLAEHSTLMKERFDQVDRRFDDFHALTRQELERRHEFSEGEQRRIRERMDEFERRLAKVEEKIDR